MPRFSLHLHNRLEFVRDEEGMELPDLGTARQQAIQSIRSVLGEEVQQGLVDLRGRIEIANDNGDILASIPFAEAVELLLEEQQT